jgi:threonine dehydratase
MLLSDEEKKHGVVAASAGNHALALAWHGRDLKVPVTVVMPTTAPMAKVQNCRNFGANVILKGEHIQDAKDYCAEHYSDLRYINGYDDPEIVAGAGTMGIEIMEQLPDVDAVIVPIGGAGLIAGVSLAIKTLRPSVTVMGVEPVNVASYAAAMKTGEPVYEFIAGTLADGLAVPVVGPTAFKVAKHYVDDTVTVDEGLISIAVLRCLEMEKIIVEGGGAAALAAILPGGPLHGEFRGKKVVLPICGGNIDTTTLGRIIDRGLAADKRLIRFTATVSDRPGGIANLSRAMADVGVSIKDIYHERAWLTSRVDQVQVKCVVETLGKEHAEECIKTLNEQGYNVVSW